MLSLWPFISLSPHIAGFEWSPLVTTALRANSKLLSPQFRYTPPRTPTSDLLAVHIRQGDYDTHCENLSGWGVQFMGLMQHPDLPSSDRFEPPFGAENEQQRKEYYLKRCWPSVERIVERIEEVKREWEAVYGDSPAPDTEADEGAQGGTNSQIQPLPSRRLRRLYIMTNEPPSSDFLPKLKERLFSVGDWDAVTSSDDLALITAQSHITQAIDAAIGERATVFIGNGVSSSY